MSSGVTTSTLLFPDSLEKWSAQIFLALRTAAIYYYINHLDATDFPIGAFLAVKYISRSPHLALAKSRGIQIRYCLIRSFIIIEYLSRTELIGSLPSDGLSLKVKSRMAANLSLDIIWRARSRHKVGRGDKGCV